MASNLYGGYSSLSELKKANQDRYNAATKNSQSISDYISSGGKTTSSSGGNTSSSSSSENANKSSSSNKYYTTITESNGSKSDGYIQDGVSYYSNGTPINAGASVVDSTGKTWVKGGEITTSPNQSNPYAEQVAKLEDYYKEQEERLREQNRVAIQQGTNRLNAQKSNINQAADENARQAYVQYMQSQKALPQQLASQGASGGATETAALGLQTTYQNNVNTINQNKANRLQEIDNAIVDLQNTGDLALVEQVLANNQAALDAYTAAFDKGISYNQWADQFNANRTDILADQAYRDKVYADQMMQQEKENQWYVDSYNDAKKKEETDRVITLLENGMYNPSTASALLGVSTDQLQEFVDYIKKVRNLELSNTQSLINNRNTSGSSSKTSSSSKASSENTEEKYYNLANSINNLYANNATGKKAGENVIVDDGDGGYQINPDISRGSYLDLVIARTLDSDMSDEEANQFLLDLKIKPEDISRVAAYYLK